ncbi:MAG TPA: sigma-70 family RNA polymerase sigma factor [Pyrinomonadaceae bacterium]|nr:sigma-70 family RNA polymerase sigma factor [Pyrinomonadaceae bacterium]
MKSERTSSPEERLLEPAMWLEAHGDYLFRHAMFRLRDINAAEDAVQETLLAALQSHRAYEGRSSERTWLVGILKHKIIDHYRTISRTRDLAHENYQPQDEFDPFEKNGEWAGHWRADWAPTAWHFNASTELDKKEFWATFDRCLSELPPKIAMAFTLREIDGLSSEEICEVLNLSPNNLWVMLHRARLRLRHSLEAEWFGNKSRTSRNRPTAPGRPSSATEFPRLHRALKFVGLAA